jgi:hypothetical protein
MSENPIRPFWPPSYRPSGAWLRDRVVMVHKENPRLVVVLFSVALVLGASIGILAFRAGRRSSVAAVASPLPVAALPAPVQAAPPTPSRAVQTMPVAVPPDGQLVMERPLVPPGTPGVVLGFDDLERACGDLTSRGIFLCLINRGNEGAARGARQVIAEDQASFRMDSTSDNAVSITVEGQERYSLAFGPPKGGTLAAGLYPGAVRWPENDAQRPGIDFSVGSSGCSDQNGRFRVLRFDQTGDRQVVGFVADFETTCNGAIGRISISTGGPLPKPEIEIRRHEPEAP